MHRRSLLLALVCVLPTVVLAAPKGDYDGCVALTRTNPKAAVTQAERMVKAGNEVGGLHCRAMALFMQAKYADAAKALDDLGVKVPKHSTSMRIEVLRQSASAWENAKRPETAVERLGQALALAAKEDDGPAMRTVLVSRSQYYMHRKEHLKALQDLDNLVALSDADADTYLRRAEVLIALGQKKEARADVASALKRDPSNADALKLSRRIGS